MRPFEAALKGSREIGFTIVSITLSLIAVFIPVLLMGGIVGRVFREFAVTISIAIIISGFVSLTLTPMLCARMLRGHDASKSTKRSQIVPAALVRGHVQGWLRATNGRSTRSSSTSRSRSSSRSRRWSAQSGSTSSMPKGFFPTEDTGFLIGVHRSRDRHLVRRDGGAATADRRNRSGRSRRSLMSTRRSAPAAPIRPPITAACS